MSKYPPLPPVHESPTPNLNVVCPHCQARLTVHPSKAGTVVDCPKCGGRFQLPLPTAHVGVSHSYGNNSAPSDYQSFVSKKVGAGICGILLGGLGVHKFMLGLNTPGTVMLVVWLVGLATGVCVVVPLFASITMNVIGLVEGIIYLTKTDEDFYQTYAVQKKEWF